MEEALPMAVSSAARLAPQEIVAPTSDVKAREELSQSERKSMRRQKKHRQKVIAQEKAQIEKAKEIPKVDAEGNTIKASNKHTKQKEQQELGKILSSMDVHFSILFANSKHIAHSCIRT